MGAGAGAICRVECEARMPGILPYKKNMTCEYRASFRNAPYDGVHSDNSRETLSDRGVESAQVMGRSDSDAVCSSNGESEYALEEKSGGNYAGEQAIKFRFDNLIAFTGLGLKARSIQHCDMPPAVENQPGSLQFTCGFRDALAAHTEHIGD